MIVPFIYDIYEHTNTPPKALGVFYKFVNFCLKYDFPIIAQEKFFVNPSIYKNQNLYAFKKDSENKLDYKAPTDKQMTKLKKYIITDKENSKFIDKYSSIDDAVVASMSSIDNDLVNIIDKLISKILKKGKIDAIIVWSWIPSLVSVADKYKIPVIQMEMAPIRIPAFRERLGYFKFGSKYENNNINTLFSDFNTKQPFLDRRELIALLASEENLELINLINNCIPKYEIGYALGLDNDLFEKSYSNVVRDNIFKKIGTLYNKDEVLVRWHPADRSEDKKKCKFKADNSIKNSQFILNSKRILCNISNIGYEAILYNRTVVNLSATVPTAFNSCDDDFNKTDIMSLDKLNFLTFYCYTDFDLMFNLDYIKWRLSNPSVNEIYNYNLNYILKKYNIDGIFKEKKKNRLKYILKNTRNIDIEKLNYYCSEGSKTARAYLFKLIPNINIRRKIINKIRFSSKLNKIILGNINKYQILDEETFNIIKPVLYCDKKIAINVCCSINKKELKWFLNNILFEFDLYSNKKVNNTYLNNYYNFDLFTNIENIKKYDYIINIDDASYLELFKYGFIESCISILNNNMSQFINIGNDKYKNINYKCNCDILCNSKVKNTNINKINIFNTSILNDDDIKLFSKLDFSILNNKYLLLKYMGSISKNKLDFLGEFESSN